MKRTLILIMLLFLSACKQDTNMLNGYVEGEFLAIAPTSSGLLQTLDVHRGQHVKAGDPLFSLDLTELLSEQKSAEAEVRKAQAELDDLLKGDRPEELEVILKQKEQAQATLQNAKEEYQRILPLSKVGAASLSERDEAKANLDSAQARVDELEAQIVTANLGARLDKIIAAKATIEIEDQNLRQKEKRLKDAAPTAPTDGIIEDTYFNPGEYIATGQSVVKMLPPDNVKIRFFVSQKILPNIALGQKVMITCDGCNNDTEAEISYISQESEYTPPVIFSVESRDKLVFMVEAKPNKFYDMLRPGLPVTITLGQ